MLTLFFTSFWFIMKGADFVRPSALHRAYALLWLFILGWAILVAATVFEDRFGIASGYIFVFYESAIFLATLISFLELFALPTKESYAKILASEQDDQDARDQLPESEALIAPAPAENDDDEATERTPLVSGDTSRTPKAAGGTFANYARRSLGGDSTKNDHDIRVRFPYCFPDNLKPRSDTLQSKPYENEQSWSGKLPSWTWILQFLLIGPFMIVVIGQVALYLITAVSQTGPDGSSLLAPYIIMAFFTILLLLPVGPFAHRIPYQLPTFLFLIFMGTLIYSLLAFPFSAQNRYKAYFQQSVDLETGQNIVTIAGLENYVRPIIANLPSAAGQAIDCESRSTRTGIKFCTFTGLAPKVVNNIPYGVPPEKAYRGWLTYNVTRSHSSNKARFMLSGKDTRACVLRFDRPIKNFDVHGSGSDSRFARVPDMGSSEIRLWHREWSKPWTVDVEWAPSEGKEDGEEGIEGRVVCLWSDDNVEGVIPALDEVRRYAPDWSAVTKLGDGLVEGSKPFVV